MDKILLVIQVLFLFFKQGKSIRCFECDNIPNPISCGEITTCEGSQSCFVEQVITTSANVIYNLGCESKSRCAALNGRRSLTRRNSDIVTCRECCDGPYCNNKGCGNPEITRPQRGVYCYNCPYLSDPKACESVAICKAEEQCLTSIRPEFIGLQGGAVYSSECESNSVCQLLSSMNNGDCCNFDFCNNFYNETNPFHPSTYPTSIVVTAAPTQVPVQTRSTSSPHVTSFTQVNTQSPITSAPVVTQQPNHRCDLSGGYHRISLANNHELCVKVVENHNHNWPGAKAACENDQSRLVVTNTQEKINALNAYLKQFWGHHHNFWIGLWDKDSNNKFYWLTGELLGDSGWGDHPQQPTHVYNGKPEDCVYIYKGDHGWHDTWCSHSEPYICERF